MPNEKRKPHYSLKQLHALVLDSTTRRITFSSRDGATALGWSETEIVQCVLGLVPQDFYKSMTTYYNTKLWQDVYRPVFHRVDLYVKLQISPEGQGVVISFKERRSGEQP